MERKDHKRIYSELAEEFNLPKELIEKVCDSQFEFTKEIMASGKDEPVRLQYLGLFQVKPGRRETVRKRRERMKEIHEENRQKK